MTTIEIDLTKEMYFKENRTTSLSELKDLAIFLLDTTWTVDIYRYQDAKAINLMDLGWCFEFSNRKRALGTCNWGKKTIYLSQWLSAQNMGKAKELEDTLRHEIAHALDFVIRGYSNHDKVWKLIAKRVLCNGERCYDNKGIQVTEQTKYTVVCDHCDKKKPSHKRSKAIEQGRQACGDCCREHNYGRFSDKFLLRQIQNY